MTDNNSNQKKAIEILKKIQDDVQKFKTQAIERFENNIMGIALEQGSKANKATVLVLIDDMDSKKLSKQELKTKTQTALQQMASNINKDLNVESILVTEVWQDCNDSKYELTQRFENSATVHDDGMLAAFKITGLHKRMVLDKFEKYIVSYVLVGSLVQGKATPESDIDVFIIIDDTDVKKMSRAELKDKLRAIIVSMGQQAGKQLGIDKAFNIQVYILTDFWEYMKDANPIIFTFLRDGVPLFDRGVFMPWKQLLQMGRIKPSKEAIDMMVHSGNQILNRVRKKLKEIGVEDFYWATLTTAQAAIMLYGYPPPTPKETGKLLTELFVKKEDILEKKYVDTYKETYKLRKDLEHGKKTKVSGKKIDELLKKSHEFLERFQELFETIQNLKEGEGFKTKMNELRSHLFRVLDTEEISDTKLKNKFKKDLVGKEGFTAADHKTLEELFEAETKKEKNKLSSSQSNKANKQLNALLRKVIEHLQRKEFHQSRKTKLVGRFEKGFVELHFFEKEIIVFAKKEEKEDEIVKKITHKKQELGKISSFTTKKLKEKLDDDNKVPAFINQDLTKKLKTIVGSDVTIVIN